MLYLDWFGARLPHQNVEVWVGDSFEVPADAMIKNVKWTNFGSTVPPPPDPEAEWNMDTTGGYMLDNIWFQTQYGNNVGSISTDPDW